MEQCWENWTTDQVAEWLRSKSLGHLVDSFYEIKITGDHLPRIDDDFLKTYLKVSIPSERNLILESLQLLPNMKTCANNHVPTSPLDPQSPIAAGKRPPPKPNTELEAQALIHSPDNLHSGWIIKQGGRIRTWRRRYMILHKGCLYYFENEKSQKQKGSLALPGYVLTEYNDIKDYPNCCIKLAHKNPNKRVYYICTSSQREKERWIESIQKELDLYKEENLLGQAIYGSISLEFVEAQKSEGASDEDNDDDDVNPINITFPRLTNLRDRPPDHSRSASTKAPKTELSSNFPPQDLKIIHASTMKPKIMLTSHPTGYTQPSPNSSPLSFPSQPSISSLNSAPLRHAPESPLSNSPHSPLSPTNKPDMTEDDYLIITPGSTQVTNGIAQRELPSVPERIHLPSSRPLPTPPSELSARSFPSSLSLDNLNSADRRISAPTLFKNNSQQSFPEVMHKQSLPSYPSAQMIGPKVPKGAYEDVETMDDFSQLSKTFANTLNDVASPKSFKESPTHPLPSLYENHQCDEDDGDAYISPIIEVLPEGCIQSGFTREKAEHVLTGMNHDGMYLIRNSSEENISMVLTVWCKDRCKHYKVFKHEKGYCLHRGSYFFTLEELIRQYRVSPLPRSNYILKVPYNLHSTKSRFT